MRRSGFGLILLLLAALLAAYLFLAQPGVSGYSGGRSAEENSRQTAGTDAVEQAQNAVDALNERMRVQYEATP